jgi:hypothetical protein
VKIDPLQRDVLLGQIDSFMAAAPDTASREPYIALRDAIDKLEVPAELGQRLGAVAEVLLTSGRVRNAYGPGAELALWSLFQKTPRGREVVASVDALNVALKRLAGQPIEFLSAVARGPGVYALTLKTAECQMIVRFEPAGVRVESVDVGSD